MAFRNTRPWTDAEDTGNPWLNAKDMGIDAYDEEIGVEWVEHGDGPCRG